MNGAGAATAARPGAVLEKDSGNIIGWGGLYQDPFDPGWGVEVGCSFHPDSWGRGYASELVAISLDIADNSLELAEVGAFARLENAASRRLLVNFGFEEVRFVPEMERMLYRRRRPDL